MPDADQEMAANLLGPCRVPNALRADHPAAALREPFWLVVEDPLQVELGTLVHDGAKVIGRELGMEDPVVSGITQREGGARQQGQKRPGPLLGPKEKNNRDKKEKQREWRKDQRRRSAGLAEEKG